MPKMGMNSIVSVLHQGRKFANELRKQLINPNIITANSSKDQSHGFLLEKILLSYDDALALANYMALHENGDGSDPDSNENSPTSDGSDPDSRDHGVFKKRKIMPRWSKQVHVCSGGQLDDGYSWRKYGQKNILGTNHPRAYYRCTHRNTQGCLATKQVQRTDEDPSIFEVIHHGKHTCVSEMLTTETKEQLDPGNKDENKETRAINNEQGLKADEARELPDTNNKEQEEFPLVFFPSTPLIEFENLEDFPDPGNFAASAGYSPRLLYYPDQSCFSPGIGYSFQGPELDFAEIISNPTCFTDIQFGELDFDSLRFLNGSDYISYPPAKYDVVKNELLCASVPADLII